MDIIKAFDKVWYPGLIYKIGIGIIKKYTFLINDFNTERMMQFKRGNETSEKKPFRAGVPPGVVLSPIHIHFRHTHQQKQKKVAFRRQNHISTFKKKNSSGRYLQQVTDAKNNCSLQWKIKINVEKCEAINFNNKNIELSIKININDNELHWKKTVKYNIR